MTNKIELMKQYSDKKDLDEEMNNLILARISEFVEHSENVLIGIYLPLKGEVDLRSLIIRFPEKKFAVPKIKNDTIFFTRYFLTSPVEKSSEYNNYSQPKSNEEVFPKLIFVPALAFDIRGYRLGRGRGHYDKYLAKHDITRIGICPNHKILEYLPKEKHDQRMNFIISEDVIIDLCQ